MKPQSKLAQITGTIRAPSATFEGTFFYQLKDIPKKKTRPMNDSDLDLLVMGGGGELNWLDLETEADKFNFEHQHSPEVVR